MNQEQLKEQAKNYIINNLHNESQKELLTDIIQELELLDQLKFINGIIDNIICSTWQNAETPQEIKQYNTLNTIYLQINDIIKASEEC